MLEKRTKVESSQVMRGMSLSNKDKSGRGGEI